ncbi:MAG: hypothetical protein IJ009_01900 [Clostridia bacterium]|nr:hypothetical protein [Clostridia bacterium]
MKRWFARFMYGRYGGDSLNNLLIWISVGLLLLAYIPYLWPMSILAYGVLIYTIFRTLSRNIPRRRAEEAAYLRVRSRFAKKRALRKQIRRERKTHRYFKCPACHAMLRVPRGKGEIVVTCPRCGKKTDKKT